MKRNILRQENEVGETAQLKYILFSSKLLILVCIDKLNDNGFIINSNSFTLSLISHTRRLS